MDQVRNSFERIKIVLGVSGGIISVQRVQDIARLDQLDEAQRQALDELLAQSGIRPIPDEELPQTAPAPKPPRKKEPTPEERSEHLEQALLACLKDMTEVPVLVDQYQEELPLLKAAIAEKAADPKPRKPDWILSRAVMVISRYRVRDIRNQGWVCGTHSNHAREHFRLWLHLLFSDDELAALIRYCSDPSSEKDSRLEEVLLVFLHNTPKTIVHLRPSSYYDD